MSEAHRYAQICFSAVGDCAMLVELGAGIDEALNESVLQLETQILKLSIRGIEETTPAYNALMLHYNPDVISFATLQETVSAIDLNHVTDTRERFLWRVPVCYGGEFGEDLDSVANYHHLTSDEVIARHCAPRYRVYMIGFAPALPSRMARAFCSSVSQIPAGRRSDCVVIIISWPPVVVMPPPRICCITATAPFFFPSSCSSSTIVSIGISPVTIEVSKVFTSIFVPVSYRVIVFR